MSFDTAWLDLREPADRAARDAELLDAAVRHVGAVERPLIVDLGSGTGSTMRAMDIERARWRLIDNDPALLDEAARRAGAMIETVVADLRDIDRAPLDGARLVTASALVDLVSADWIERLAARLARTGAAFYAALSYDGVMSWQPADADDAAVLDAFNGHQRSDKGFGRALGPDGAARLAEALRRQGFQVRVAPSPWRLEGEDKRALHAELLKGVALAAGEAGLGTAPAWLQRRLGGLAGSSCDVGHVDLLALPTAMQDQSR